MVSESTMIRLCDIILSATGLVILSPLLLLILFLGWWDTRSALFYQKRVGQYQKPFFLIKFRTMQLGTTSVASHLIDTSVITSFGRILRHTKLDELPQLWNVLKGNMSLVGPRPCLFNQEKLLRERARLGIYNVLPGITGLAQLRGIDMSTPLLLAETDAKMIETLDLKHYFYYLILTVIGKDLGDRANTR